MSTIKATTLSNLAGSKTVPTDTVVDGSAKAWVNFNGTGTVAIRRAFNVSSITDNGTGEYTVNFTSAMADANYAATGTARQSGVVSMLTTSFDVTGTTSALRIATFNASGGSFDPTYVSVAIFS